MFRRAWSAIQMRFSICSSPLKTSANNVRDDLTIRTVLFKVLCFSPVMCDSVLSYRYFPAYSELHRSDEDSAMVSRLKTIRRTDFNLKFLLSMNAYVNTCAKFSKMFHALRPMLIALRGERLKIFPQVLFIYVSRFKYQIDLNAQKMCGLREISSVWKAYWE